MIDWNVMDNFEKYPSVTADMQEIGSKKTVLFMDEGKDVSADVLATANKAKGIKGIKARDQLVFTVQNNGSNASLWISAQNYTSLKELKKVRDSNGGKFKGARCYIERVSKNEPDKASFKFTPV